MKPWEVVSTILTEMSKLCVVGETTKVIDAYAERRIAELGATSYNKGYKPEHATHPYPFATCISVNNVIVHGYPTNEPLGSGDIVTLDIGIKINGQCGDAALTVMVGEVENKNRRLVHYSMKAVYEAIKYIKAGVSTEVIAEEVERYGIRVGYAVNRRFGGHTIGEEMHMKPNIYNTVEKVHTYDILKEGQIICIEVPMSFKDALGITFADGWITVTTDGRYASMFEHMVRVTKDGCEILTTHFDDTPLK